jgi:hypothetical protein
MEGKERIVSLEKIRTTFKKHRGTDLIADESINFSFPISRKNGLFLLKARSTVVVTFRDPIKLFITEKKCTKIPNQQEIAPDRHKSAIYMVPANL